MPRSTRLHAALRIVPGLVVLAGLLATAGGAERVLSWRQRIESDWARQEAIFGRRPGSLEAVDLAVQRARALAAELGRAGRDARAAEAQTALKRLAAQRAATAATDAAALAGLYNKVRWLARALALSHPAVDFEQVLFVRRHRPGYRHQCSHRVGEAQTPGADLCVLTGLAGDGTVRSVLGEKLAPGGIGRPDLSYDARRVVFPYAAPRARRTSYGYNRPGHRGGACHMYDLYEIALDGTGLKRLTHRPDSEDTEPCYLPDGRIAFTSTRDGRLVQCGDWALVFGLHVMNADGTDQHKITEPQETEFYPSMLADGRILYTRWDYVMKAYNVIQQLWVVNPDGTKAQLAYGDHFAFSVGPLAFQEARQIPGTSKVVATGSAHHNTCAGPLMIVDLAKNRQGPEGMVRLTEEVSYPETSEKRRRPGWYCSPYPLTETLLLASYSFESRDNVRNGYGLYLVDAFGGKELLYRDPAMSCYSPIPVRPRKRPRILPDTVAGNPPGMPATVVVADIYRGLDGVRRGEVQYLRILEAHVKTVHTTPQRCDVGLSSGWDLRGVLGTVPVEADGSVCFEAPSGRLLFFEALDKDYLEIRRMRNYMNAMPGEKVSCVGCHEPPGETDTPAATGRLLATARPPSKITPPPWGAGTISFTRHVQPVLDAHCVRCHDGTEGKDKSFDLRGRTWVTAPTVSDRDQGPQHGVTLSFVNLVKYVSYTTVGGFHGVPTPLPANAIGSRQSRVMRLLRDGHYDVTLPLDHWRALAAWIDCNAQFYGSWDEIRIVNRPPPRRGRPGPPVGPVKPTAAEARAIAGRRAELAAAARNAEALRCYLDCGAASADGAAGGPTLRVVTGRPYRFYRGETPAPQRDGSIVFDEAAVVFELAGLKPGRTYRLGLSWWDHNDAGRRQSVAVHAPDGTFRCRLQPATALPAWQNRRQPPQTLCWALPAEAAAAGKLRVEVACHGGPNAVVGEVWLYEGR